MTKSVVGANAADQLEPRQAYVAGPFFFMVTVGVLATGLYGTSLPAWNVGLVLPAFLMSVVIGLIWMIFFTLAARVTPPHVAPNVGALAWHSRPGVLVPCARADRGPVAG